MCCWAVEKLRQFKTRLHYTQFDSRRKPASYVRSNKYQNPHNISNWKFIAGNSRRCLTMPTAAVQKAVLLLDDMNYPAFILTYLLSVLFALRTWSTNKKMALASTSSPSSDWRRSGVGFKGRNVIAYKLETSLICHTVRIISMHLTLSQYSVTHTFRCLCPMSNCTSSSHVLLLFWSAHKNEQHSWLVVQIIVIMTLLFENRCDKSWLVALWKESRCKRIIK